MLFKTITRVLLILVTCVYLISCDSENSKIIERIENKELDLSLMRFDREFATSDSLDLESLKIGYPFFFNSAVPDSLWYKKMKDTLQNEINEEVLKAFPDFDKEKQNIERFVKYLKFYFTAFKQPTIVTIAESVDYKNKVVTSDSLLVISLDNYLGREHRFYESFPDYIKHFQDKKYLISDVAGAYAKQATFTPLDRRFISYMVYHGKLLYFKDLVIPWENDAAKIHYTQEQLEWAKSNETKIWEFFIEKDYVFSTQADLKDRFINPAPFSKFYLELDNDSSPRIGQYIGWQIVRDFMKNNPEIEPNKLMLLDAQQIFKQSNYKP
ncbi:gliding motility lipoprotein GldB [Psychroflexus sp. ALD_RP9]|uniref:gliding motility lipoprotein GldB n=1 Tax=Psychroflexus sp. ALD_RP9 TaxID=2777186 RepID=UPI001A8EA5D1|nr:gliding motility lipoprotein GldB [Psychroflexus sp. ALD_RP9]QSS96495.1 gliding motility lipoprotein GldB [Psychroflexus sp. ALD_RP9]